MSDKHCPIKNCPHCGQEMSVSETLGDPAKVVYYKCGNDKCDAIRWQLLLDGMKLSLISSKKGDF